MATYVLIHGSWQGGWTWKPVGLRLQAEGHLVYRPSLDGCAERAHALRPEITLDTQGAEVARLMFYEDLSDVILVGTSSGGMVIARAAELAADRIRRLVFVDALCPMPGETVAAINNRPPRDPSLLADGLPPDQVRARAFADLEPAMREWAVARYTLHPRAPTEEPVDLREFWSRSWRVDVLRGKRSPQPSEAHQRRTAEKLGGTYTEIDAGHYPMLTNVDEVARYLLAMA
ncbi:MAG TPA: alpha/beta hydrolase [Chloroflexota bacterium]|nr:alpha/beta hydrolase [Chloroflexota bacterium]